MSISNRHRKEFRAMIAHTRFCLIVLLAFTATASGAGHPARLAQGDGTISSLSAPPPIPPVPPIASAAQYRRWSLGLEIGGVRYSGDIDDNSMFSDVENQWSAFVSLLYRHRFYTDRKQTISFLVRTHACVMPLKTTSKHFSFSNTAFGGGVGVEMEFFLRSKFRPYVYIGLGALGFLPETSYDEYFSTKHPERFRGTATVAGMLPAGIGFNVQLGRQFDIGVEFSKTLTSTDNLDGWESGIMDNFQTIGIVFVYTFR
jgi:hypothetical protein